MFCNKSYHIYKQIIDLYVFLHLANSFSRSTYTSSNLICSPYWDIYRSSPHMPKPYRVQFYLFYNRNYPPFKKKKYSRNYPNFFFNAFISNSILSSSPFTHRNILIFATLSLFSCWLFIAPTFCSKQHRRFCSCAVKFFL